MVPSCWCPHTTSSDGSASSSPTAQQRNACRERQLCPAAARGSRHCLFAQISSDLLISKILSLSQACTGMGSHGTSSLPRHTELFWFETYDCSLLKEIILSQSVSLLISTYELLTVIRNLFLHWTV